MKRGYWIAIVAAIVLAVAAGASAILTRGDSADVQAALVTYLDGTGINVNDGSCVDGDFEKDGLHLWTCRVVIPETVLTPEMEQTWDVAVADDGTVADASRHK